MCVSVSTMAENGDLDKLFFRAIHNGSLENVISCLKKGALVNAPINNTVYRNDHSKLPPLYWAICYKMSDVLKILIWKGADVNLRADDRSPLRYAIRENSAVLVHDLLTSGANCNEILGTPTDETLLQTAASHGDVAIVKMLVDRGADVNVNSPQIIATLLRKDKQEALDHLVQNNLNVNKTTSGNRTPLLYAVENNNLKMVQWLLEHGAKFTVPSALVRAIETNQVEIVKLLLTQDVRLDFQWNDGCTLLLKGVCTFNLAIVKELIAAGVDVNLLSSDTTSSLIEAIKLDQQEIAALLIDSGSDPNFPDGSGDLPLLAAVRKGQPLVVKILLAAGADPSLKNKTFDDALTLAIKLREKDIVELLTQVKCKIDDTLKLLLLCIEHGSVDVAEILLKKRVNLNASGICGFTPLTKSIDSNSLKMVEMLIRHGADVDRVDQNGNIPLVLAASRSCLDIFDFLIESEGKIDHIKEQLDEVARNNFNFGVYLSAVREREEVESSDGSTDEEAAVQESIEENESGSDVVG